MDRRETQMVLRCLLGDCLVPRAARVAGMVAEGPEAVEMEDAAETGLASKTGGPRAVPKRVTPLFLQQKRETNSFQCWCHWDRQKLGRIVPPLGL